MSIKPSLFTSSSQSRKAYGAQPAVAATPSSWSDAVNFNSSAKRTAQASSPLPAAGAAPAQPAASTNTTKSVDSLAKDGSARRTTTTTTTKAAAKRAEEQPAAVPVEDGTHQLKHIWTFYFAQRANNPKSKKATNTNNAVPSAAAAAAGPNVDGDEDAETAAAALAAAKEKESREEWEGTLHTIGSFSSVEAMHPFLAHLATPSDFNSAPSSDPTSTDAPPEDGPKTSAAGLVTDLHLFKSPAKPLWEDQMNLGGGRWVLRLRKGVADRIWEEVLFALVGETLCPGDHARSKVNGVVLSIRKDEDILSIWCAPASRSDRDQIREGIRAVLEPLVGSAAAAASVQLDFKPHPLSQQQHNQGGGGGGMGRYQQHRDRQANNGGASGASQHRDRHSHHHHNNRETNSHGINNHERRSNGHHQQQNAGGFGSYTPRAGVARNGAGEEGGESKWTSHNEESRPLRRAPREPSTRVGGW